MIDVEKVYNENEDFKRFCDREQASVNSEYNEKDFKKHKMAEIMAEYYLSN